LQDVINGLDEKVEAVIDRHEKDFIVAYQRHMNRVQKDLEQLKKKLTEQEYLMRRTDKIAALEKEVGWYRDESLAQQKQMQLLK
jgi:Skp family chaperone for outer membrane proteins